MSESKRHFSHAIIAVLIRVAGAGLVFAMQVVLARLMPEAGFGGFVSVWSWTLALGSFAAFGFAEASVRFLPRYQLRGRAHLVGGFWRFGLGVVSAGSGLIGVLALLIGLGLGPQEGAGLAIVLVGLSLPFLALEYFLEGVARSFGWFRLAAVPVYIVRPILVMGAALALSAAGVTLSLPVVGAVMIGAMALVSMGLGLVVAQRLKPHAHRGAGAVSARQKRMWVGAALPLLVLSGLEDLVGYADVLMLSVLASPGEVGIYFAAARCLALGGFVAYAMTLVAGRRYALDVAERAPEALQRSVSGGTLVTLATTLVVVLATIAVAPLLLGIFGPGFEAGYPVVAVLGLGMIFKAMSGQAQEALIVLGRYKAGVWVNVIALGASVALVGGLAVPFGLVGAAWGSAIGMALRSVVLAVALKRATGLSVLAFKPRA